MTLDEQFTLDVLSGKIKQQPCGKWHEDLVLRACCINHDFSNLLDPRFKEIFNARYNDLPKHLDKFFKGE
jgi:hypothetical protein